MKYYLKPDSDAKTAFAVLDEKGCPVYKVKTENSAIGRHFLLVNENADTVAKIMCIRISSSFQYTVTAKKKHVLIAADFAAANCQPVKIKGIRWQFRGNLVTRAFDIINESGQVIMTHGRCWNAHGSCYAANISERTENKELCLGIAVALDCTDLGRIAAPVPIG